MKVDKYFLILCAILITAIFCLNVLGSVKPVPLDNPLTDFPKQIGEFAMFDKQEFSVAVLENAGMDEYLMWQYKDQDGYTLGLYIGYYRDQTEGSIIHSPKHCMPGSGWEPFQFGVERVGTSAVNRMLLQKGADKQLAYYWFQGRGRIITSEYVDRAYMVIDSVLRQRSDGALIRIIGSGNDVENAEKKLRAFMSDLLPILDDFLPK